MEDKVQNHTDVSGDGILMGMLEFPSRPSDPVEEQLLDQIVAKVRSELASHRLTSSSLEVLARTSVFSDRVGWLAADVVSFNFRKRYSLQNQASLVYEAEDTTPLKDLLKRFEVVESTLEPEEDFREPKAGDTEKRGVVAFHRRDSQGPPLDCHRLLRGHKMARPLDAIRTVLKHDLLRIPESVQDDPTYVDIRRFVTTWGSRKTAKTCYLIISRASKEGLRLEMHYDETGISKVFNWHDTILLATSD